MKDRSDDYEKPKIFRKKKKKLVVERDELHHPAHKPYERKPTNWTHNVMVDGLGDEDDGSA